MSQVIIIAEAGINHNGDIELAKKLIDVASEAKADYVKFQTFVSELIVDATAKKADYQITNVGDEISQLDMIKGLELSIEQFEILNEYCKSKKIKFLTTAADLVSLKQIERFDLDFYKISSGEIINKQYLKKVANLKKPVIISSGMANLGEIENAIKILIDNGLYRDQITVLHCNTEYPTPMEDVNLKAMNTIGSSFQVKIGYSDHTLGIEVPIAAAAMGAKVIEKHFTLDKTLPGPDHSASLEPTELKEMVSAIRNIEKAIGGTGIKMPSSSEGKNIEIVRKSIFVNRDIKAGEKLKENDLVMKRPGDGISAKDLDLVIGKAICSDIISGAKLHFKDIVW